MLTRPFRDIDVQAVQRQLYGSPIQVSGLDVCDSVRWGAPAVRRIVVICQGPGRLNRSYAIV